MPSRLRSIFKRKKKKKKEPEVTVFGEPIIEEKKETIRGKIKQNWRTVTKSLPKIKPKSKLRLSFLLKVKRIIAGLLTVLYAIATIMLIPDSVALLFFATFFILLDYLWKTRMVRWVEEVEK